MCAKISKNCKTAKWFLQKKQKMTKICLAMIFFCNFAAKIMKISALYRRFREWQKNPFHYQDHSDHVERCANCGTEFQSNFCPVCGQKSGVGPINWRSVRQGLMVICHQRLYQRQATCVVSTSQDAAVSSYRNVDSRCNFPKP